MRAIHPGQLLLDCEIRDWAHRAIRGVRMGEETQVERIHRAAETLVKA